MAIIAALPKHATIHGNTIQVLPDITSDFSSDNYLNILRESGAHRIKWATYNLAQPTLFRRLYKRLCTAQFINCANSQIAPNSSILNNTDFTLH